MTMRQNTLSETENTDLGNLYKFGFNLISTSINEKLGSTENITFTARAAQLQKTQLRSKENRPKRQQKNIRKNVTLFLLFILNNG